MIRLSILAGTCAVLAAGMFGVAAHEPELQNAAHPQQLTAPAIPSAPLQTLRPDYAQSYGTVCETPDGRVCTVPPQPINSRCQCGQSFGRIVR